MNAQHYFNQKTPKSPFRSRFAITDNHGAIVLETGSSVKILREINRLGFYVPEIMTGPACWTSQWNIELEAI